MHDYKILAHRGASAYAPENTMPAFELAIEKHADGFEIDITFTRDSEIVVIHDDSIDRTSNGKGRVSLYTLSELKGFNFNRGFEETYPDAPIPTLSEVLELVKRHSLILNIEVKNLFGSGFDNSELALTAAQLVKQYDMAENVIFSSFNHHSMVMLKTAFPEMKTALLYFENLYKAGQYALTANAAALHPLFISVNADMVQEAHEANIMVTPYTVNDPEIMRIFKKIGVDGIITDNPDVCYRVRTTETASDNSDSQVLESIAQRYLQQVADHMRQLNI